MRVLHTMLRVVICNVLVDFYQGSRLRLLRTSENPNINILWLSWVTGRK